MKCLSLIIILNTLPSILESQNGRELDSMRFQRMISKDTNFLKQHIDDYLMYIHSNGLVEDKNMHIEAISQEKIVYENFVLIEADYLRKRDYLIGKGLVQVSGKFKGEPFHVQLRFSNIYKRSKGKWLFLYWQSTKTKNL